MSLQRKPRIAFVHGLWADGSCFGKLIPFVGVFDEGDGEGSQYFASCSKWRPFQGRAALCKSGALRAIVQSRTDTAA